MKKWLLLLVLWVPSVACFATWSIIVVDEQTGKIGIAGASCTSDCSGIGSVIPGKGAIIVQAMSNYNAHDVGRRLIREGYSLDDILNNVLSQARFDPQHQQYALVTLKEMTPRTFTGDSTFGFKGSLTERGISVQGNLLSSPEELRAVLDAALRARQQAKPIDEILLSALEAGAKSGGDKRCGPKGATSAFLLVANPGDNEDSPALRLVVTEKESAGQNAVTVLRGKFTDWKASQGDRAKTTAFSAPKSGTEAERRDSLSAVLRRALLQEQTKYNAPSIVMAVVYNGSVVFTYATGTSNRETNVSASVETPYPIHSMTKVFTACLLMHCIEKKIVAANAVVGDFLPELKGNAAIANISLLSLATHRSGLPRSAPPDLRFAQQVDRWIFTNKSDYLQAATEKEVLACLGSLRLEYAPYDFLPCGDRHYSNLGYSLLGICLERATHKKIEKLTEDVIFAPLKMKSSGFYTPQRLGQNNVAGYFYTAETRQWRRTPVFVPNAETAAAGICASVNDVVRFLQELVAPGITLLSPKSKRQMFAESIAWRQQYPLVYQEGAMLGYRSVMTVNPKNNAAWVILTNGSDFNFSFLNNHVNTIVTQLYQPSGNDETDRYTGRYELSDRSGALTVVERQGSLYADYLQNELPPTPLQKIDRDHYKGQERGNYTVNYEFIRDEFDNVTGVNMGQLFWKKQTK